MVVIPKLSEIKKRTEQLLEEQQQLIEQIKAKYPDFYSWATENNVDLTNLHLYTASIAAALVISIGSSDLSSLDANASAGGVLGSESVEQQAEVTTIEHNELAGLSHAERMDLVWERYGPAIKRQADKYQVDEKLILSTIMLESGGDTYAIRHEPQIGDASYGLGQILYGTARGIGFTGTANELYDPETNIELIARYHRRNMDVYGPNLTPVELTTAYNAGTPYNTPHPGHLTKFNMWYHEADNLISSRS